MNDLEHATRFLATLRELDEPGFVELISAMLIIRDSHDAEELRLAAKAILRNQERLEEKLDDIKSLLGEVENAVRIGALDEAKALLTPKV